MQASQIRFAWDQLPSAPGRIIGGPMPEALILEFTDVDASASRRINASLGIDMTAEAGDWPPGLLSHAAGTAEDGTFVVTEVWSSRADQQVLHGVPGSGRPWPRAA